MDENAKTGELRRKLEKDPGSRLFAQFAEELRKEGKFEEAIAVTRKGLEKNPNYPSARLTLARALLDTGRPEEAKPELEQIVKASPDNILAGRLLGDVLEDLGSREAALQQFERTLRLSPGDKGLLERISQLKALLAAVDAAEPGLAAAANADAEASAAVEVAAPAAELPSAPPEVATPPEVPAAPSALALDRDLSASTFSPGSLNISDVAGHLGDVSSAEEAIKELPSVDLPSVALPSVELPSTDPDVGATTLPLSSVTLADLYLQQGLKAEASAVLSQVVREEPENTQAKSKLAAVTDDLAQAVTAPPSPPPAPLRSTRAPRTRAQIREHTILSLKSFESAVEREAINQRASELSTR
jgi:tetratricopeptide (TPR) repeat protein